MPTPLLPEEQTRLEKLSEHILEYYDFKRPPVPVEKILREPPEGLLKAVDITDLSMVFGIGEHPHEYRMAMARLLYREICRHENPNWMNLPYHNEAARYFAACLLVPTDWVIKASRWPLTNLQQLSETFQVPEYVMTTRLSQLGKSVRGMH